MIKTSNTIQLCKLQAACQPEKYNLREHFKLGLFLNNKHLPMLGPQNPSGINIIIKSITAESRTINDDLN